MALSRVRLALFGLRLLVEWRELRSWPVAHPAGMTGVGRVTADSLGPATLRTQQHHPDSSGIGRGRGAQPGSSEGEKKKKRYEE